ncbi:MAG: TolC family protein [Phycisphaerales bacterium]
MTNGLSFILLGMLVFTGCASDYRAGPFADWIDRELVNAEPVPELTRRYRTREAGHLAEAGLATLPDDAGPEEYVLLALERNPGIKSAEQKIRRLANRIPQVTSLDDPMFQLAPFGEMAETAAGQVGAMTALSQRLPLPSKLRTRGRIVAQDVAEAVAALERVRLRVIADTRLTWWRYYYTTRAIQVTQNSHDLLSQFQDVAEAKYRAGTATQQDVLRASVELSSLDNELIALRQRLISAGAMLNRLIDRRFDAPLPEPTIRTLDEIALELATLLTEAARSNPGIRQIHERIEGYKQRLDLARLNRWPDLTVSFNYNLVESEGLSRIANGDDQWWFGFGFNLPIWTERLDAAEREALRGRLENIAALGDERNRVDFRVQDAFAKVQSQQQQVVLFRDVIVPQAQQTVDASLSSYRSGKVDFLTLIDNWRKLLVFQLMYHQNLAQFEQSFAELQRAVGHDLNRTTPPSGATNPLLVPGSSSTHDEDVDPEVHQ